MDEGYSKKEKEILVGEISIIVLCYHVSYRLLRIIQNLNRSKRTMTKEIGDEADPIFRNVIWQSIFFRMILDICAIFESSTKRNPTLSIPLPNHLFEIHADLKRLRDKVIAHNDKDDALKEATEKYFRNKRTGHDCIHNLILYLIQYAKDNLLDEDLFGGLLTRDTKKDFFASESVVDQFIKKYFKRIVDGKELWLDY